MFTLPRSGPFSQILSHIRQNPIWRRSSKRGTGGTRPRLAITGSKHQVAESLSKLSLSGLRWEEASSKIYQTVRTVVGTTRQKAKYWVYDNREEVDQIVLERKAAGNTAQAKTVAKRKFAVLRDSWWDRRADQLQCAADAGDIKKGHQLLREICGPTRRTHVGHVKIH